MLELREMYQIFLYHICKVCFTRQENFAGSERLDLRTKIPRVFNAEPRQFYVDNLILKYNNCMYYK